MLKNPNARITTTDEACMFIAGLREYEPTSEMLTRLDSQRENGRSALQQALHSHDGYKSIDFFRNSVFPFLTLIDKEEFSRGVLKSARDTVLCAIGGSEPWLRGVLRLMSNDMMTDDEMIQIGWLLLQSLSADEDLGKEARKYEKNILPIIQIMSNSQSIPLQRCAALIQPLIESFAPAVARPNRMTTVAEIQHVAGGRHNNDFFQFRDVELLPSTEELLCTELPYLPRPADVISEATMLDRNFRLLRHDLVKSLQEEFGIVEDSRTASSSSKSKAKPAPQFRRAFEHAQVIGFVSGFRTEAERKAKVKRLERAFFEIKFEHGADKIAERSHKSYWLEKSKRALQIDSLVCIVVDGNPYCFGLVVQRDEARLGSREPSIGVAPCSMVDGRVMTELQFRRARFTLVQCQASFFAYEFILKRLKAMKEIPFKEELVRWKKGDEYYGPVHARNHAKYADLVTNFGKHIKGERVAMSSLIYSKKLAESNHILDSSQKAAILHGLTHRVALIQGPPGYASRQYAAQVLPFRVCAHFVDSASFVLTELANRSSAL
jgi:hypothetical protein